MTTRGAKNSTVSILLALALLAVLASCGGGGGDDDCVRCSLSGNAGECPMIDKQCGFGTVTVQQCSGSSGSSRGCCATSPSEVSCPLLAALAAGPDWVLSDGLVRFVSPDTHDPICTAIDPVASGWIAGDAPPVAWHEAVALNMAHLARAAGTYPLDELRLPEGPRDGATPFDPGAGG